MPNYQADGTPYEGTPNRAERIMLGQVLAQVLTATPDLPTGIEVLQSPASCIDCYRTRAVVSVSAFDYENGMTLCMEHAERTYRAGRHTCADCGHRFYGHTDRIPGWIRRGEIYGRETETMLCYSCSGNYRQCTECTNRYDATRQQQCCAVVPRCNMCNRREAHESPLTTNVEVMSRYSYAETETIAHVCLECVGTQLATCVNCSRLIRRRETYSHNGTDDAVCLGCVGGYVDGEHFDWEVCGRHGVAYRPQVDELSCCHPNSTIHPYSYKPTPRFRGEGPMFYGAEVEICANDIQRAANVAGRGFKGLVYLKDDGSVSSGFEMVTHPMSFGYWASEFPWNNFDALRESGAYEHRSCGIHVHASRAGFSSPAHQHRWLAFFDRNKAQIEKVARRENSSYAQFNQLSARDKKTVAMRKDGDSYNYHQRYSAVNVNNRHTYEVRIFATSIDKDVVFAAISFVSATVEYTRQLRSRDVMKHNGMTWTDFRSWVETRPEYSTLLAEMNRVNA